MEFRLLLVALSVAASLRYAYWRVFHSISTATWPDLIFGIVLLLAEGYGVTVLFLGYFQTFKLKERKPIELPLDRNLWPTADVFVVTYNEQTEVLRRTLVGALKMDYPQEKLRVYLLDDGRRQEMKELAHELGCLYITRSDNMHAKAGNLNNALWQTEGEIIAIFDSDQVPVKSFLTETVGLMLADEKCGLVQTPQHNFTPSPFQHNLRLTNKISSEEDFFYRVAQVGNDYWNAGYFCGCCAIFRRSALVRIGGIAVGTVGEDAHTSMRLHAAGYRSVYYNKPLAAGLSTPRFEQYIEQRMRWGRGMAQILRLENPLLIRGLSVPQRLNYFLSIAHFFGGIPRLILISAPLVYLLLGWKPFSCDGWSILLYAGPHIFFALVAMSYMSKNHRQSFWSEVFQTATSFFLAPVTLIALISPRLGKFTVTSKRLVNVDSGLNFKFVWPSVLMIVISLAAICSIPFTWRMRPGEHTALLINLGWAAHNLVILVAVLLAARNRMQLRNYPRVDLELPCNITASDRQFTGMITDLSETGGRAILSNCEKLPNRFAVQIESSFGEQVDARAKLIWCEPAEDGKLNCGFSFANLDRAAHHSIIGLAFCDPNRWSVHNRPADRPLRSYWYIVSSAVRAFRRETPYEKVPASVFDLRPAKPPRVAVAATGLFIKEIPCTKAQISVNSSGIEQSHVPTHNLLIAAKLARKASAVGASGSD